MKVAELMIKDVETISPNDTALKAAKIMSKEEIGSLVVVQEKKIIGILTEQDLVKKVAATEKRPSDTLVKEIMTSDPTIVHSEDPIEDVITVMNNKKLEHLPVEEDGELKGIIASYDLLKYGIKEKKEEVDFLLPSLLKKEEEK